VKLMRISACRRSGFLGASGILLTRLFRAILCTTANDFAGACSAGLQAGTVPSGSADHYGRRLFF